MNFKKCIFTIASVLCLTLANQAAASAAQTGLVTATVLNVRSSTSTSSSVIGSVTNGTELEIINCDGDWYQVKLSDGTEGYVSSAYITPRYYGRVTATSLKVRSSTGTSSPVITQVASGTVLELLAYDGSWYHVKLSDGTEGYVSADYISLDAETQDAPVDSIMYGYVNATTLNIRESTGTYTNILTTLPIGTKVELLAYDGSWYRISLSDGTIGFASADYISLSPIDESVIVASKSFMSTAPYVVAPSNANSPLGEQIIETAKQYIGCPYVWAAEGPNSFDCSGFTMYVMNLNGIKLPHQSGMQYNYGYEVSKTDLQAGDLVFFNSKRTSGVAHVGIYIGEGNFIHASSGSAHSVTISNLSENYYTVHYLGAKRVI